MIGAAVDKVRIAAKPTDGLAHVVLTARIRYLLFRHNAPSDLCQLDAIGPGAGHARVSDFAARGTSFQLVDR